MSKYGNEIKGSGQDMFLKKLIKGTRGEGVLSEMAALVVVVGVLALIIGWFVMNANEFQLQTALNLALKKAQVDGYVTSSNIQQTETYLASVGLTNAVITATPTATSPLTYGSNIEITIIATTMTLPNLNSSGQPAPGQNTLTATGDIASQYAP